MVRNVDEWEAANKPRRGSNQVNERQIFSVLVRAIGILVFIEGLRVLWFAVAECIPATAVREMPLAVVAPSLLYGVLTMVLGLTMIRWPQWLVHLAWLERLPTIGRTDE